MKIAVCDDDALSRKQIAQLLSEYTAGKELCVSIFDRASTLMAEANRLGGFDLYILDVIMPELSGIGLASRLRQSGFSGKILFLTSSRDYAIDAFRVQASGYILKPVVKSDLFHALDEIISSLFFHKEKSLIVKAKESSIRLPFDSIVYAELSGKTVVYHLVSKKVVESISIRSTFSEAVQELLRDSRFTLCGSTKLINLHYVAELDTESLVFKNGTILYIGKRASRILRSVWYDFWFDGRNDNDSDP